MVLAVQTASQTAAVATQLELAVQMAKATAAKATAAKTTAAKVVAMGSQIRAATAATQVVQTASQTAAAAATLTLLVS